MKMRASHILFSYAGAKNSTHSRGIAFAMKEAERVQKKSKMEEFLSRPPQKRIVLVLVEKDQAAI